MADNTNNKSLEAPSNNQSKNTSDEVFSIIDEEAII